MHVRDFHLKEVSDFCEKCPASSAIRYPALHPVHVLKSAVSRDFSEFFPTIQPTWAPDKQAKMVLLKDSFSRKYARNK